MSNNPFYKRAFVRGLNAELIRQGIVVYPSKEAADQTADYVAARSGMPDPMTQPQALDVKVAADLMDNLIEGAKIQCEYNGNQYSPHVTKTAQAVDAASLAQQDVYALMEKCAAEAESGDNTLTEAAKNTDMAERELKDRPEGYANTDEHEHEQGGGATGEEGEPSAPGREANRKVPGTNSAIETSKNASLQRIIRRIAKTAGNDIHDAGPNDMPNAAKNSDMMRQEMKERPEDYAFHGEDQGRTEFNIPSEAQTGKEEEHDGVVKTPEMRNTNSVQEMVGGTSKSAFEQVFETTARNVIPFLPPRMQDNTKVAHVRQMVGLDTRERGDYLAHMYASLGATRDQALSVRSSYLKTASDDEDDDADGKKKPAGESVDRPEDEQEGASYEEKPDIPADRKKDAAARSRGNSLTGIRDRLKNLHL